ncbi:MAG: tetratricopeptide repeat protein [Acidobacteriota bacterium]
MPLAITSPRTSAGAQAYFKFAMAKIAQQRQDFGTAVSLLKDAVAADPTSAVIRAELAMTYLRVRDFPAAEQAAKNALQLDPDSAMAHRVLAQLYYSRARRGMDAEENTRRAMAELEASLNGDGNDDPETLVTLGRFYYEGGEFQKAVEVLGRFADIRTNPSPSALFLLARALMQLERYPEAEKVLQGILTLAPDWLQVLEMLARVTRVQGDFAGSIEPLEHILAVQGGDAATDNQLGDAYFRTGRYEEAAKMFEMAGREDPTSLYSRYYLGLTQERLGRLGPARETFEAILQEDPDNAEVLFRIARLDEREGATRSAVANYRRLVRALEKIPDEADPRRRDIPTFCGRAGVLLLDLDEADHAVDLVSRCMADTPAPAPALHLLMVRALLFAGKDEKALAQARRSTGLFTDEPRFRTLEPEVLLEIGREHQAEARLDELLADPGAAAAGGTASGEGAKPMVVLVSDAYFNAGALAERQGDIERAEHLLGKAIEVNPDNGPALNYLGYLWADAGRRLDEALEMINRAVALDPENAAYLDSLGWVYFRLGRADEASEQLQKAVERMGLDATIHEHLGDVEEAVGNEELAVRHWRRALELGPDDAVGLEEKIRKYRKDE